MPKNTKIMIAALSLIQIIVMLMQKKKRHRSIGVRPLFRNRRQQGDGHNLLNELRLQESTMFFSYTRMNFARFEYLLRLVGPLIKCNRKMKTIISPHQRLAMTLRFLAGGDSYGTLSFAYRCGRSTVSKIISKTLRAIVHVLIGRTVKLPETGIKWKAVAEEFWDKWNLPHCVGAIDGRHMQVISPSCSGSTFFNYKKTFSLILMAVADAEYTFIAVDVGAEGSQSDGAVFKDSKFGRKLILNSLNLPGAENLPNSNTPFDYFFVRDGAFQLRTDLLKPYACRKLSEQEAIYNYRISRGRRVVENAFGILVARWRVFGRPLNCTLETADFIVLAAVCLHNFILKTKDRRKPCNYVPTYFVDTENPNGSVRAGDWRAIVGDNDFVSRLALCGGRNTNRTAINARVRMTEYFNAEGAVPWQVDKVRKGFWGAHISQ